MDTVFLSHNSADKLAVEEIKRRLESDDGRFHFWLDQHDMAAGAWLRQLEDAIDNCIAAVVFFGPHGLGRIQDHETQLLLLRAMYGKTSFHIIPVLLPGASKEDASGFVSLLNWVDFNAGLDDPSALEQLTRYLQGVGLSPIPSATIAAGVARLTSLIEAEMRYVLDEAQGRVGRSLPDWRSLERLLAPVRLARGLRPVPAQKDFDELERRRSQGDFGMYDLLERHRSSDSSPYASEDQDSELFQKKDRLPTRPTVWWEDVSRSLKRAVVLGDPGFGKTTLLWHETVRRCATALDALIDREPSLASAGMSVFIRSLELAEYLPALPDESAGLDAIVEILSARHALSPASRGLLREKIRDGTCLVAVDGLDEIPLELRRKLESHLSRFARRYPQSCFLFSSRLAGFSRCPIPVPDIDHFEVLALDPTQVEAVVEAWFTADDTPADGTPRRFLRQFSPISQVLRCPLLLRLACQVIQTAIRNMRGIPECETSGDLLNEFVGDSIIRWSDPDRWPQSQAIPNTEQSAVFPEFLGKLALRLWLDSPHSAAFERPEIIRHINALRSEYPSLNRREDLLGDICKAGILTPLGPDVPTTLLAYAHRSFGEYLAASALAQMLEGGESETLWHRIEEYTWNPAVERVIAYLAGRMLEPGQLLQRLLDRERDDIFGHRNSLAVLCLDELRSSDLKRHSDIVDTITRRNMSFVANNFVHLGGSTPPHLAHILRGLPALLRANGRIRFVLSATPTQPSGRFPLRVLGLGESPEAGQQEKPLSVLLAQMLNHPCSIVRMLALQCVTQCGHRIHRIEVLEAFAGMLRVAGIPGMDLMSAAWVTAAGALNSLILNDTCLKRMMSILCEPLEAAVLRYTQQIKTHWPPDQEWGGVPELWAAGSKCQVRMGFDEMCKRPALHSDASEAFIMSMAEELSRKSDDPAVGYHVRALGCLVGAPLPKDLCDAITRLLLDPLHCATVLEQVRQLPRLGLDGDFQRALVGLFAAAETNTRIEAVRTYVKLMKQGCTPADVLILERLTVVTEPSALRVEAISGLAEMCSTRPDERTLTCLDSLLNDSDEGVRERSVVVLANLSKAMKSTLYLDRLVAAALAGRKWRNETFLAILRLAVAARDNARVAMLVSRNDQEAFIGGALKAKWDLSPIFDELVTHYSLGSPELVSLLCDLAARVGDPEVGHRAVRTLQHLGEQAQYVDVIAILCDKIAEPEASAEKVRRSLASLSTLRLTWESHEQFLRIIEAATEHPHTDVQYMALAILVASGSRKATALLRQRIAANLLSSDNPARKQALEELAEVDEPEVSDEIVRGICTGFGDPDSEIRHAAARVVEAYHGLGIRFFLDPVPDMPEAMRWKTRTIEQLSNCESTAVRADMRPTRWVMGTAPRPALTTITTCPRRGPMFLGHLVISNSLEKTTCVLAAVEKAPSGCGGFRSFRRLPRVVSLTP